MRSVPFNLLTPILFLLPLIFRLLVDWYKIVRKKQAITKLGYLTRNILTGGGILLASWLNHHYIDPNPYLWANVLYSFSLFLLLFDYSINLARGLNWDYISPNTDHPSIWERIRQAMPPAFEISLKIWIALCGLGCYYSYYLLSHWN